MLMKLTSGIYNIYKARKNKFEVGNEIQPWTKVYLKMNFYVKQTKETIILAQHVFSVKIMGTLCILMQMKFFFFSFLDFSD